MNRLVAAGSVLIAVGALLGAAPPASAATDVFQGTWTSIDPGDGSAQTMSIQGSGTSGRHSVFLRDSSATVACGGAPANVAGSGMADGDTLYWWFAVTCPGSGRPPITGRVGPGFFDYHSDNDTLVDDAHAVWSRA